MMDANESIGEKPGGLSRLIGKVRLIDLLKHRHPNNGDQNTYTRGSRQIDYILGTATIRDQCMQAGLLLFGTGYHSDLRAIFVVINIDNILNTKIGAIQSITARKLIQAFKPQRGIRTVRPRNGNRNVTRRETD
jgi:hypothetical protein